MTAATVAIRDQLLAVLRDAEGFTHARDVGHVPDELKRRVLTLARGWAPNGDGGS